MNVESAAVFLAGTILYALGIIIILIAVVVANNIIHKFWKSLGWQLMPNYLNDARFIAQEDTSTQKNK